MKTAIAKALWAFTLTTFALSSCATKSEDAAKAQNTAGQAGNQIQAANSNDPGAYEQPAPGDTAASGDQKQEGEAREDSAPSIEESEVLTESKVVGAEKAMPRTAAPRPMKKTKANKSSSQLQSLGYISGGGTAGSAQGAVASSRGRRMAPGKASPKGGLVIAQDEYSVGLNDKDSTVAKNSESYKDYGKNPMVDTAKDRLSTFAVDVDTASYAIARRKIMEGAMPVPAAVRVEEFVNYFKYDYAAPSDSAAFAVHMDMAPSPFAKDKKILRVGVQAKKLKLSERKRSNLVFLVDVSGSMQSVDKLELAKRSMRVLVDNLRDGDTVSLVTYAGATKVVLQPTGLENKAQIISALEDLRAGGGTGMASGMQLAYELAAKNLGPDSNSRVIVLSDGDANIGSSNHTDILKTIAGKVKEGVTMSAIGFGMGNYKDEMMEQLANKGNGNYFYIDSPNQARRVFQEQLGATLQVVAKDVKIQVDFDPNVVASYRLIGYENRDIADNDFRNDKVDAGEIGAGHTVTAMYEVVLKSDTGIPATVRLRAKKPRGSKATESAHAFDMKNSFASFESAPGDFRFATAVMASAEVLRHSEHASNWSIDKIVSIANGASESYASEREEFIALMEKTRAVKKTLASR